MICCSDFYVHDISITAWYSCNYYIPTVDSRIACEQMPCALITYQLSDLSKSNPLLLTVKKRLWFKLLSVNFYRYINQSTTLW